AVGVPASCSLIMPIICSSLNLDDLILRLLVRDELYPKMEEETGLRSMGTTKGAVKPVRLTAQAS
ncbi:MAG: hypothetical protein AAGI12_02140, partial [Pseudomonadota bacterium]